MPAFSRCRLLAVLALACAGHAAWAGGSSAPFGYTPDPALRTDTPRQLQARVRRSCEATQARVQSVSTGQVSRPCGCYATAVMRTLDAGEIAAYRETGVFNDTARGKALAAIDRCGLRRPI